MNRLPSSLLRGREVVLLAALVTLCAAVIAQTSHEDEGNPRRVVEGLVSLALPETEARRVLATGAEVPVSVSESVARNLYAEAVPFVLSAVPLASGESEDFEFHPLPVWGNNARIVESDGKSERLVALPAMTQYHGRSTRDSDVFAYLGVSGDARLWMTVWQRNDAPTVLMPSDKGRRSHVLAAGELPDEPRILCDGAVDPEGLPGFLEPIPEDFEGTRRGENFWLREANILIDVDSDFYEEAFSSDADVAAEYMANLIGAVATIYIRDIDTIIRIEELVLWTENQPFGGDDSEAQLSSYRNYNREHRNFDSHDLAYFMAGKRNLGGRAYTSSLCNPTWGYGVCNLHGNASFPISDYVWDVFVTAHEIGHNFGSQHTHCYNPPIDCCFIAEECTSCEEVEIAVGTIMSYCHAHRFSGGGIDYRFHDRVSLLMSVVASGASCLQPREERPPNHLFPGSTLVGSSGSVEGNNINAVRQNGEPNHADVSANSGSVWYLWFTTVPGTVTLSTCQAADFNTVLAAYVGNTIDTLTPVAANDDHPDCGTGSRITFEAQPGIAYRIAVAGFDDEQGTFTLDWQFTEGAQPVEAFDGWLLIHVE